MWWIILLENIHSKFNISGLNTLLGDYEVAVITFAIYLVLSIKSVLNLFLWGAHKNSLFSNIRIFIFNSLARFCTLKRSLIYLLHSPICYFHFMEKVKELN